jgi:hypothetical protein
MSGPDTDEITAVVRQGFRYGGRIVRAGDTLHGDDPVLRLILAKRPELVLMRWRLNRGSTSPPWRLT